MEANETQSQSTETPKTEVAPVVAPVATEAPKEILGAPPAAEARPGEVKAPAEINLKFPEGFQVDDRLVGEFKPLAQKYNLTSEQAQSLFDLHFKSLQAANTSREQTQHAEKSQWIEQAVKDKEFGGTNFKQNVELANQAYSKFATPELQAFLKERGLVNHPEVVRHFYRLGKSENAEDKLSGTSAGASTISDADKAEARLRKSYPTMFPQE